jgi:adenylate cyclase
MSSRLTVRPGTPDARTFTLKEGTNTIGRTPENDICVNDDSLSRAHARLDVRNGVTVLHDLRSTNGTFVDGTRVERMMLGGGHTLAFGNILCHYVFEPRISIQPPAPQPSATRGMSDDLTRVELGTILDAVRAPRAAMAGPARPIADRDRDKLRILLKVSQLLASPASLDSLLSSILDLTFEILDIDRAAILMVNTVTGALEPRVTRSRTGDASFSRSIARYVLEHGVAALFSDARADSRITDDFSVKMQDIRTSMCAPLRPRENVIGVLYVDNRLAANRFDETDLEFLSAFANQAAVAIDNSILNEALTREAVTKSSLLRFFPPTAIPLLVHEHGANLTTVEGEATVLFCDISGYTAMASHMRPAEIIELLNEYFPVMAEIVFRHEGTLEKYIGDALLALWGVPLAHDDDIRRALCAAVEMQRAVAQLNERWRGAREIGIHIGICTGVVAAGNIGSKDYVQYAAVGDTTNVASRICGVAQDGDIVIDEVTASRAPESVKLSALGAKTLRGKNDRSSLFRVEWREMEHA